MQGGKDLHGAPKLAVTFYRAMKTVDSYLPGYQNFLSQILTSTGCENL